MIAFAAALLSATLPAYAELAKPTYEPRGTGGGGAMSGFSISPYSSLRFVGTDMGTLFRSENGGRTWMPLSHAQVTFSSDLSKAASVGFSSDPTVVFFANAGRNPKRSEDSGLTWTPVEMPITGDENIRYWAADSRDQNFMLCATTKGLLRSNDKGRRWERVAGLTGRSLGTFVDSHGTSGTSPIFHATPKAILRSLDGGRSFTPFHTPEGTGIRAFAGGHDAAGLTLAFIDTNGVEACAWANMAAESSEAGRIGTMSDCGFVWTKKDEQAFKRSTKDAGRFVRMAENDSKTIYVTAGEWVREYGTKIWVSTDAGTSWALRLHQHSWDREPYQPWPKHLLEHSGPGLEVGWNDGAYESFTVNARDSREAGGTGYYFLHLTRDRGEHWLAPFTEFADTGDRAKGKKWKSTGLEVTSVLKLKFHPRNPQLGYASLSDMAGWITEDGGKTFRISRVRYNTNYDYAFDPAKPDTVYAVSGDSHDFPLDAWGNVLERVGGVFRSDDRGRTWIRLTPETTQWNRQYVSLGYDPHRRIIYAGSQGKGLIRSTDEGRSWHFFNDGLPEGDKIIAQIEIDPASGNAYALLTGDAPRYTNRAHTGVWFLDASAAQPRWKHLRGTVQKPEELGPYELWWYPTGFAVDWSRPSRDVIWLVDLERNGAWLATGAWKTTDRGTTWTRSTQFTHATSVAIDPNDSNRVYLSGGHQLDGSWGKGGAMYTGDGGRTWKNNTDIPLLTNTFSVRVDPNKPSHLFYTFFGGGLLYGPRPE